MMNIGLEVNFVVAHPKRFGHFGRRLTSVFDVSQVTCRDTAQRDANKKRLLEFELRTSMFESPLPTHQTAWPQSSAGWYIDSPD